MAPRVVSDAAEWERLAVVADVGSSDLHGLSEGLKSVLRRNYFGIDCVEGEELYQHLSAAIQSASVAVTQNARAMTGLGEQYRSAARALVAADSIEVR